MCSRTNKPRPNARTTLAFALLSMATLAGCSLLTPTIATVGTACSSFRIITYSASQDSTETIRQLREHNAAWRAVCG